MIKTVSKGTMSSKYKIKTNIYNELDLLLKGNDFKN